MVPKPFETIEEWREISAQRLGEVLKRAKSPVAHEVARAATVAQMTESKAAAMAVLVSAGVPMVSTRGALGTSFTVNGHTVFIGS